MKLLDQLHKLGILRVGATGGAYKSYKDMPDELMFDNAYDKEKDLAGGSGAAKTTDPVAPGRRPSGEGSGVLFLILLVVSIVITLFFGLMVDLGSWFLALTVILILFVFKLFSYRRGLCSLKFIWIYFFVYIIFSIAVLFIAVPGQGEEAGNAADTSSQNATDIVSRAEDIDDSDWIDYTGAQSSLFTFRYPASYQVEENGTTTMVYVDKEADYDYHMNFTALDGEIPMPEDCQGLAEGVAERYGGEVRYAESRDFFGSAGCEYGINVEPDGSMVYEIAYNFATPDKTYYVTSYAKSLSDLVVLSKSMESFRLN